MRVSFARLQLTPSKLHTNNKARHRIFRQLKVISINVNGLRGKALQIQELICTHHPAIIVCQETKLDASIIYPVKSFLLTSRTVIRKDCS